MPSHTDEILIAGIRADVRQMAAEAPKAAEIAGRAGVQAGIDEASAKIVKLANGLAFVLNEGLEKIAAETRANRKEAERLRAAGARPSVVRALTVASAAVVAVSVAAFCAAWYLRGHLDSQTAHADSALARWAVTPAGRDAYALDQANASVGGIGIFAGCTGRGWQIKMQDGHRVCWTYPATGGVVGGWRLEGR